MPQREKTADDIRLEAGANIRPPRGISIEKYLAAGLGWDKPGDEGLNSLAESVQRETSATLKGIPQRRSDESLADYTGRVVKAGSELLPGGIITRIAAQRIKALSERFPQIRW